MNIPTTGSPTITLFQLRSNYHTLLNSPYYISFYLKKVTIVKVLKYQEIKNKIKVNVKMFNKTANIKCTC